MAALHARVSYTGLVLTRKHADKLLRRLQSLVIARATHKGEYDPRLVETLTISKPKAKAQIQRKHHNRDRCRDKACAAYNKIPTHGTGIQDGCI